MISDDELEYELKIIRSVLVKWPSDVREMAARYPMLVFSPQSDKVALNGGDGCFTREQVFPEAPPLGRVHDKPPIGLKPKNIHDTERAFSITEAINRYLAADKTVPPEWLDELRGLTCGPSSLRDNLLIVGQCIILTDGVADEDRGRRFYVSMINGGWMTLVRPNRLSPLEVRVCGVSWVLAPRGRGHPC